ncbi:MAG TPA: hypothetical protein VF329_09505 [Gammaproteobacteria bacterium]
MTLLKDETTARLDEVQKAGTESLGLYEDLAERIDDRALAALVRARLEEQKRLLERLAELRRERGDLPQAGDPERSHLEAAGAVVRAILLPGATTAHYVESLLGAAVETGRALDAAASLALDPETRRLLDALAASNGAFIEALRERL